MANYQQTEFVPAFPYAIKWSANDNPYDDKDKNPKAMTLTIPVESIPGLISHLMALEADASKHKHNKGVWDIEARREEKKSVVYINAKGKESQDGCGSYGNISPRKIDTNPPF